MKNENVTEPSNDRRMVPFIIFFAFVILMTVVILSVRKTHSFHPKPATLPTTDEPIRISAYRTEFNQNLQNRMNSILQRKGDHGGPVPNPKAGEAIPPLDLTLFRVQTEVEQGRSAEALTLLRTLLVFYPESVPVLKLYASQLFVTGSLKEAEFYYRKLLQFTPNDPLVLNDLGLILAKQCRYEDAVSCIERAILFYPAFPISDLNLAGIHARAGNRVKAFEHLRKACRQLGSRIIPLTRDADFDSIRSDPEFRHILLPVRKEQIHE